MKDFYAVLKENIGMYEGRHDDLIYLAPDWYRLLTRLLDDARLPSRLRPLVACATAYFILPVDIISEEIHGPYGYVDDIFLSAFIAEIVRKEIGTDAILVENWEGETDILALTREILEREEELIGNERSRILDYTGCDRLLELLTKRESAE